MEHWVLKLTRIEIKSRFIELGIVGFFFSTKLTLKRIFKKFTRGLLSLRALTLELVNDGKQITATRQADKKYLSDPLGPLKADNLWKSICAMQKHSLLLFKKTNKPIDPFRIQLESSNFNFCVPWTEIPPPPEKQACRTDCYKQSRSNSAWWDFWMKMRLRVLERFRDHALW